MGVALGLSGMHGYLMLIPIILGSVGLFHLVFMAALYFYLGTCVWRVCDRGHFMMRLDTWVNAPLRDLYVMLTGYRLSISEKPSLADSVALFIYDFLAPIAMSGLALVLIYLLLKFLATLASMQDQVKRPTV
jgi:hypothetical protein